jgi:hypothetical protein
MRDQVHVGQAIETEPRQQYRRRQNASIRRIAVYNQRIKRQIMLNLVNRFSCISRKKL